MILWMVTFAFVAQDGEGQTAKVVSRNRNSIVCNIIIHVQVKRIG